MNITQSWMFGQKVPANFLNANNVNELIAEAKERAEIVSHPDINCILDVLEAVADCWADPEYHLRKKAQEVLPGLIDFSAEMVEAGLNVVSHICRKENLEKRLSGELGGMHVLNRWQAKPHLGFDLLAKPRGVLLHLTAGNVFVGAVDSLVSGIITKNVNILKMSRVDTFFPALFIESIKENDPQGIIWPNQAALLWKGGSEEIENPLLQSDLTVVFWGGLQALESIRSRIGNYTKLVENGPRYSFAVIDGKRIEAGLDETIIKGLALDLCRWDQQACSSPHVVYVIDEKAENLNLLMEELYDELLNVNEELPIGNLTFDEKVEIRKVRDLARMQQAQGHGRLLCPEKFDFSLIYEENPEFKISCLNRTLFFKCVESVEELMVQIKPISKFLQTVGCCATAELQRQLEKELIDCGAKRVTDFGGMSEGHDGAPHEGGYLLRDLVDWVAKEYKETESYKIERFLKKIQGSPYYAKIIDEAGGCNFKAFKKLPLLDRETFYRNSPPESTDILTGPMTDAYVYASGGTTGNPKFTFYSNPEYVYVTDILGKVYENAGITADDRVANLFIAGNLWTSFNVAGRALENIGCLNLPVGGASDMDNILKYIQVFNVNAIVGLPSIIVKLAEEVKKRKLSVKIEKILYGGEHLRPQTCEFLRETIGAISIRSAGYACVDTGLVGWQCMALEGSIHHVLDEYCFVEILDPETGEECPVGKPGELIVTNLDRTLMPVVRYRTGDLGVWIEDSECECGFSGKSFELLGRCDDLLVIGGINLMPVDVAAGLGNLDISPSFQFEAQLKTGKEHLCLRLEAEKSLDDEKVIAALKSGSYKIAESLEEGWMTISIEWYKPGQIPRNDRTGKLKVVLDKR